MDYLDKVLQIAQVDRDDHEIGPVERWDAHKKGILHRGFTLTIQFQNQFLIQHRKHPVFDDVFDLTISSHPIVVNGKLQSMSEAIYSTLQREWSIDRRELDAEPEYKGKIYYQAQDPKSEYQEHEMCHIYTCTLKELKLPNLESAYGFSLQDRKNIENKASTIPSLFAPWVKVIMKEGLL